MTRLEFLSALSEKLGALDEADRLQTLSYYSEMISDRMEDGEAEEEAVAALGEIEEIALRAISERPVTGGTPAPEAAPPAPVPAQPRRHAPVGRIIGGVTAFVWIPLLFALWTAVFALFAAGVATAVAGIVCIGAGIGNDKGLPMIGAGLIAVGIGIALTIGAAALCRRIAKLTKWAIVRLFASGKEA